MPCRPESCQGWGERSTHLPAPAAHLPTHPLLLLTPRTPCCRRRARRGKSLCFFLWGGGEGLFTSAYTPQLPLPPQLPLHPVAGYIGTKSTLLLGCGTPYPPLIYLPPKRPALEETTYPRSKNYPFTI